MSDMTTTFLSSQLIFRRILLRNPFSSLLFNSGTQLMGNYKYKTNKNVSCCTSLLNLVYSRSA